MTCRALFIIAAAVDGSDRAGKSALLLGGLRRLGDGAFALALLQALARHGEHELDAVLLIDTGCARVIDR